MNRRNGEIVMWLFGAVLVTGVCWPILCVCSEMANREEPRQIVRSKPIDHWERSVEQQAADALATEQFQATPANAELIRQVKGWLPRPETFEHLSTACITEESGTIAIRMEFQCVDDEGSDVIYAAIAEADESGNVRLLQFQ
jgi:hypothetical protein